MANRLQDIWPNVKKIVNHWQSLPKSCRLQSKSYEAVDKAVDDPLILPKLSVFASLLQVYLSKYQTDMSMIPYLGKDLQRLY